MDHGFNAPTAWLWHAVFPNGDVVTFAEHYQSEWTVAQHAAKVKELEATWKKSPDIRVADPATAQRQGVTGTSIQVEYAKHGLILAPGNNDVATGVNQVASYLKANPETGKPRWLITENCVNLIKEMQRLRWATYASKKMQFENNAQEKIHKKDDHACDSARYFFTFMPELKPEQLGEPGVAAPKRENRFERFDTLLAKATRQSNWTIETDTVESLENDGWSISYD